MRIGLIGGGASVDTLEPNADALSPELAQSARQLCFSKLADVAPDGSFVLQLAKSMEPNADATVWQVKLKPGVTWHDGSELTADDVIYTFKRILDPANADLGRARGSIDMIDPNGLEKVDNTTLIIKLVRPWSDLISAVGQRYISIVKNGAKGPWTVENFIGTGAFKLTEWVPGERYVYVRNENYFETGKPYLDGIEAIGIPDPWRGSTHCSPARSTAYATSLRARPNWWSRRASSSTSIRAAAGPARHTPRCRRSTMCACARR